MNGITSPYTILLLITTLLSLFLAYNAFHRRAVSGAGALALLMLAVAIWCLAYAFELCSTDLTLKIFWVKTQYFGILLIPVFWLVFALQYSGRVELLSRRNLALLLLGPFVVLILVWTNEWHNMMWDGYRLVVYGTVSVLEIAHGTGFWLNVIFAYSLILTSTFFIIQAYLNSGPLHHKQAGVILFGALVPWIGNVLYLTELNPLAPLDITPFSFVLTGLAVTWGLLRFRLLDIVPVVGRTVIESLSDGVIVLDAQDRVVEINQSAVGMSGCSARSVLGEAVMEFFQCWFGRESPELVKRVEMCLQAAEGQEQLILKKRNLRKHINLKISPLQGQSGQAAGRIVVLSDVTGLRQAEDGLVRQLQELSILHAVELACVEVTDEDELIRRSTELIAPQLFPDNFGLLLVAEREQTLYLHRTYRGIPDDIKRTCISVGRGITGQVAKSGLPMRVLDVKREPNYLQLYSSTRSELCVPIKIGNRVIGVINAESADTDAYNEADERLLVTIAGQLATAIDRLRTEAEERRMTRQVNALYQASQEVVTSLIPQQVYHATHKAVERLIPCDAFLIGLLDEKSKTVQPVYFVDEQGDVGAPYCRSDQGLCGQVLITGEALIIGDVGADNKGEILSASSQPPKRSLLAVPMQLAGKAFGLLCALSVEPRAYTHEDQRALSTLANQVVIAIENARLYEETSRRTSHLETLNSAIIAAATASDLESLLNTVLERVMQVLDVEYGGIRVKSCYVAQGLPAKLAPAFVDMARESGVKLEDFFYVTDWRDEVGSEHAALANMLIQYGIYSSVTAPILAEGQHIGGISLASKRTRNWSGEELALVEAIGRQLGSASERLYLLDETQQRLNVVSLLSQVISVTAAAEDISSALNKVCYQVAHYFQAPLAGFALLSPDGRTAEVIAEYQAAKATSGIGLLIPVIGNPSMEYILEHNIPLAVSNAQSDPLLESVHEIMRQRKVVSVLLVPIIIAGDVVGTLEINHFENHEFSQSDIELVQNVASQVGQALERVRLFTATQEQAERMSCLAEVSSSLSRSFTVDEVVESIGKGAQKLGEADRVAVVEYYPDGKIRFLWSEGLSQEYLEQIANRIGEMPGGRLFDGLQPIFISDIENLADFSPLKRLAQSENYRGLDIWPLVYEGQVIAAVACYYLDAHFSDESLQEVMLAFARQSVVALQNSRLFKETRRRAVQMEALNAIIASTAIAPNVNALLESVLEHTLAAIELDNGSVWVRGHTVWRGLPADIGLNKTRLFEAEEFDIQTTTAVADWQEIDASNPRQTIARQMSTYSLRASLIVPVIAENRCIGGMWLASETPRNWNDEEITLVETVGRQLGSAVERLNLLDRIQAQAQQMQQIMDTVPEGVVLLDQDKRVILTNPAASQYLRELTGGIEIGEVLDYLANQQVGPILQSEGSWIEVETDPVIRRMFEIAAQPLRGEGSAGGWVLVLRDVTSERETQLRIQMQDRLATVGQLAAGIAHDFNNIMAAIVVYTDLLLLDPHLSGASQERLTIIHQQIHRAASLIRQILDFSRRSVLEHSQLDLLPFIKELDKLLERVLPETIRLELKYRSESYMVNADPTRLQQAFMNLAVNARDAMPVGGTLRIVLDRIQLIPGETYPMPDLSAGEWVRITISDTGQGIPAELRPRIFEPFFTTKPVGQGTGLGLAQVYGIIKQHDGSIDVESEVGEGTVFTIYLPALPLSEAKQVPSGFGGNGAMGSGETVMLVEDDLAAREALITLLEAQNYHVLAASDGLAALKIFERDGGSIALVVSDLVMPEMGGLELFRAIQSKRPEIKVMFITGHPLDEESMALLEKGDVKWLQKPFSVQEFSQSVQSILEEQHQ